MKDRSMVQAASNGVCPYATFFAFALFVAGCSEQLDAGSTRPRGLLPVDERNPVILTNDGAFDNWLGEYAVLLANGEGPKLAAIVVSASPAWPDLKANFMGWHALVDAARQSGLKPVPEPTASVNSRLTVPSSGKIEDTTPSRSDGARLIVDLSAELSLPYRPVLIVTGGALTDIADAYLMDPRVAERVVVISSLGALDAAGAAMGIPNGEMDPWADRIVATRFRYIQVSAYYDQLADVPDSRLANLPNNAFGDWMRAKQPKIYDIQVASDQVALLSAWLPGFVVAVQNAATTLPQGADSGMAPRLTLDPSATNQLVTETAGPLASARLWELLLAPSTFSK
jgi:hypothetical protein